MIVSDHRSAVTLGRLAFRLGVVLVLSMLWPGESPAQAAALLCLAFAVVILRVAHSENERPAGPGLNRWHEGAALAVLGLGLLSWSWFGRGLTGNHHSDLGLFEVTGWANAAAWREAPLSTWIG